MAIAGNITAESSVYDKETTDKIADWIIAYMHGTSIENAKFFFNKFVEVPPEDATVVEFGSQDINGSIRQLIPEGVKFVGIDCIPGKGVDIVARDPYKVDLPSEYADIVVSSSTLEHVEFFWLLFMEMVRITKKGGLIYIQAPSSGPYHPCPVDCWRFYPGSGTALEKWSERMGDPVKLIYSHISEYEFKLGEEVISGDQWKDWIVVFRK
jgi:SAM-dependent methyltransferase